MEKIPLLIIEPAARTSRHLLVRKPMLLSLKPTHALDDVEDNMYKVFKLASYKAIY